jgi:hypothetical protein
MKSRAGSILEKFTPMSLVAMLEGKPPGAIAPIGKGMTRAKLNMELQKVFRAYADPTLWEKIQGVPNYERRLDQLAPELVEAALANGMNEQDIKEVVSGAKGQVVSKWTDLFWKGINTKNDRQTELAAEAIVRLGAGFSTIQKSFNAKKDNHEQMIPYGTVMTAARKYYYEASAHIKRVEQEYQ